MIGSRARVAVIVSLTVAVLGILFVVFIAVREDAALVEALAAAGTVAAAGFAAVAAVGSMRAATESRVAAERTRLAAASSVQPRLHPAFEQGRGILRVTGTTAIEVTTVWQVAGAPTVTSEAPRIDAGEAFEVTLPAGDLTVLWVDYRDASGAFRWNDTWDAGLRRLSSDLVD